MLAVLAVVTVLRAHRAPAVVTRSAVPVIQPDVRAICAVGIEDAPDNGEEVTDSALFKSRSNGGAAVSLTESLIADVRMSD